MKRKTAILIATSASVCLLAGGVFAAWAVTDNADPFKLRVSTGEEVVSADKQVTLSWGESKSMKASLANVKANKSYYAGVVAVKAETSSEEAISGQLTWKKITVAGNGLAAKLNVKLYAFSDAFVEAADGTVEVPANAEELEATVAGDVATAVVSVTHGVEKKFVVVVSVADMTALEYEALNADIVDIEFDWGKSDGVVQNSRVMYVNAEACKGTALAEGDKVYAYAWSSEDPAVKNAGWPGVELAKYEALEGAIYLANVSSAYDRVIFAVVNENLTEQTDDLELDEFDVAKPYYVRGEGWRALPEANKHEFYLVGDFSGWNTAEGVKLDTLVNEKYYEATINSPEANMGIKVLDVAQSEWYAESSKEGEAPDFVFGKAGRTLNVKFYPAKDGGENHDKYLVVTDVTEAKELSILLDESVAADEAKFYVYAFGGEGEAFEEEWLAPAEGKVTLAAKYEKFIVVRMDPDGENLPNWDAKWNQSPDIAINRAKSSISFTGFDSDGLLTYEY